MLLGLAKDMMQGPMAKHTRGPARNYYEELIRLVKEYKADMVLLGAHIGCKSGSAIHGIVHDKLKEKGIPCLTIQFDVTDTRVVSPADIRRQVSQFMEVIMKV
jgi:benzoyl-CoA reductase/2-hydroxyglutaryl-CoA dehydratase subunit BcrC/BadD/HgdB